MPRFIPALMMTVLAAGLGACNGPEVVSASERQIVLNAPDLDRADRHCRDYGKSAQNTGQTPLRVTYACR
jgi:hypothetical protein